MNVRTYESNEVKNLLFSSEWEKVTFKKDQAYYYEYIFRQDNWSYHSFECSDSNLSHYKVRVGSSDVLLRHRIQNALGNAGILQFIVSYADEDDGVDYWINIYVSEENYKKVSTKLSDKTPLPSIYALENKIKEKLPPTDNLIYLDRDRVPGEWLEKYLEIKKEELGESFSPAWNIPSKKQLILKLAEHYSLF